MSFVNNLAAKIGLPIFAVPLGFVSESNYIGYHSRPGQEGIWFAVSEILAVQIKVATDWPDIISCS